jgi:hypothetical protein
MSPARMRTPAPLVPDRCRRIRDQLRAFASGTLNEAETGDVRDHLLSCQSCAELFSDLLMEDVAQGRIELEDPPFVPPAGWYDAYLRADHGRWGTFWKAVRDALQGTDVTARAWGEDKRREIGSALASLAVRHGRENGAAVPEWHIDADVVVSGGDRSGSNVRLTIEEPPRIADGQFRLRVSTTEAAYADALVVCTLQLPDTVALSFAATMTLGPDGRCVVEIRERDLPAPAQALPAETLRFTVFASGGVPRGR